MKLVALLILVILLVGCTQTATTEINDSSGGLGSEDLLESTPLPKQTSISQEELDKLKQDFNEDVAPGIDWNLIEVE